MGFYSPKKLHQIAISFGCSLGREKIPLLVRASAVRSCQTVSDNNNNENIRKDKEKRETIREEETIGKVGDTFLIVVTLSLVHFCFCHLMFLKSINNKINDERPKRVPNH